MHTRNSRHRERSERTLKFVVAVACLYVLCITPARAQIIDHAQTNAVNSIPASLQPAFDVVSIHPMKPDNETSTHITNSPHNGSLLAVNVNLKALMEVAYEIPDLRMYGGPDWVTTQKYSLEAKADSKLDEQLASLPSKEAKKIKREMLDALLANRFKLKVHPETRELPIYALVVARGGEKLEQTDASKTTTLGAGDRIVIQPGSDSLEVLSYELSWRLGRPVLDRTGLHFQGAIKINFQDDAEGAADSSEPSVFTAIQEQLGLKLEPTKGPVTVLVIDRAEKPTGN